MTNPPSEGDLPGNPRVSSTRASRCTTRRRRRRLRTGSPTSDWRRHVQQHGPEHRGATAGVLQCRAAGAAGADYVQPELAPGYGYGHRHDHVGRATEPGWRHERTGDVCAQRGHRAITATSANSLTMTVTLTGAGVGLHNVTVATNQTASTTFSVAVLVPAPTLITVPAAATKNQLMTITGTNFLPPVIVTFTGTATVGPGFIAPGESRPRRRSSCAFLASTPTRGRSPCPPPAGSRCRQPRWSSSDRLRLQAEGRVSMRNLRTHVVQAALVALAVIAVAGIEGLGAVGDGAHANGDDVQERDPVGRLRGRRRQHRHDDEGHD